MYKMFNINGELTNEIAFCSFAIIYSEQELGQFQQDCISNLIEETISNELSGANFPVVIYFDSGDSGDYLWDIASIYPTVIKSFLQPDETINKIEIQSENEISNNTEIQLEDKWYIKIDNMLLNKTPLSKKEIFQALENFTTSPLYSNIKSFTIERI